MERNVRMKPKMNETLWVIVLGLVMGAVVMIRLTLFQPSATQQFIRKYAQEKGISYREYPASLVELLERNPETESFVLNYPFRQEIPIDMTAIDRSQGVPLLLQWDPRWGYDQYGDDFVANTGCGPLCLSMVGWYLTGDEIFAPDQVIQFARDQGYYSKGNGSKWTLISEGGPALGLKVKELPLVEQKIVDYLKAGNLIIAVMGPGDFTTTGHYIVLTGYKDGMITVNDPNSLEKSQQLWSYETIASQVRNLWLVQPGENS